MEFTPLCFVALDGYKFTPYILPKKQFIRSLTILFLDAYINFLPAVIQENRKNIFQSLELSIRITSEWGIMSEVEFNVRKTQCYLISTIQKETKIGHTI